MRRDDAIGRVPQGVLFGQGFRIRDVERRAPQSGAAVAAVERVVVVVGVEGGDEVGLHDDLAAGDVGDEGVLLCPQDGEFLRAEQVRRLGCQGHADEEVVDVLGEEAVQGGLVRAAVPGCWDRAVRVAGAGDDEARVVFRVRRWARGGRVRDHVHAHAAGHAGDLAADAPVAQDAESLARVVPQARQFLCLRRFAPFVVLLPGVEEGVVVGVGERGQDDPFGDLGAVDARRGGQWDRGVCVDWRFGNVVRAGGEEVDELELGACFWGGREGGKRGEDGRVFVEFCRGDIVMSNRT